MASVCLCCPPPRPPLLQEVSVLTRSVAKIIPWLRSSPTSQLMLRPACRPRCSNKHAPRVQLSTLKKSNAPAASRLPNGALCRSEASSHPEVGDQRATPPPTLERGMASASKPSFEPRFPAHDGPHPDGNAARRETSPRYCSAAAHFPNDSAGGRGGRARRVSRGKRRAIGRRCGPPDVRFQHTSEPALR